jgi:glucose-1-phosphatase
MSIQAIIWDLGGVLVRTEDYSGRIRWAQRLGVTPQSLEAYVFSSDSGRRAQAGEISDDQHWQNVADHFDLTGRNYATQLGQLRADFWSGDRLDEELVDFIRSLRPRYKTALLSNNFAGLRGELREQWKIEKLFDAIVISAEVKLLKPGAEIYLLTLNSLAVQPDQAIFIDDFQHNIIGAQAVGMHTIHFANRRQACAELEKYLRQ